MFLCMVAEQKFMKELKRQLYQCVILVACLLVFMWWQVNFYPHAQLTVAWTGNQIRLLHVTEYGCYQNVKHI